MNRLGTGIVIGLLSAMAFGQAARQETGRYQIAVGPVDVRVTPKEGSRPVALTENLVVKLDTQTGEIYVLHWSKKLGGNTETWWETMDENAKKAILDQLHKEAGQQPNQK